MLGAAAAAAAADPFLPFSSSPAMTVDGGLCCCCGCCEPTGGVAPRAALGAPAEAGAAAALLPAPGAAVGKPAAPNRVASAMCGAGALKTESPGVFDGGWVLAVSVLIIGLLREKSR